MTPHIPIFLWILLGLVIILIMVATTNRKKITRLEDRLDSIEHAVGL